MPNSEVPSECTECGGQIVTETTHSRMKQMNFVGYVCDDCGETFGGEPAL